MKPSASQARVKAMAEIMWKEDVPKGLELKEWRHGSQYRLAGTALIKQNDLQALGGPCCDALSPLDMPF